MSTWSSFRIKHASCLPAFTSQSLWCSPYSPGHHEGKAVLCCQSALATSTFPCCVSRVSLCHIFNTLDACPETYLDGLRLPHPHHTTGSFQLPATIVAFVSRGKVQRDLPAGLGPVLTVAAGYYHTCAVRSDGRLICFGRNGNGQCDVPSDLGPVLAISAGNRTYLCQCGQTGQLVCFWTLDNSAGQCDVPARSADQFWQSQQAIFTLSAHADRWSARLLWIQWEWSAVTPQLFGTSLVGHCHTCAAQRGQIVSLRALETSLTGRVIRAPTPLIVNKMAQSACPQTFSSSNLKYCLLLPSTL